MLTKQRIFVVSAFAIAITSYSLFIRREPRPEAVMPFTTSATVYSTKPCRVSISVNGKPIVQRQILFSHKIGPRAYQADISVDAQSLTIGDGQSHVLLRTPSNGVDILTWTVHGQTASSNGGWQIRRGTLSSKNMDVDIEANQDTMAVSAT